MIEFSSLFSASAVAFLTTLLLTPAVRNAFQKLELVDRPDGARKVHDAPVPRIGGIPIAFSYVAAYVFLLAAPWQAGPMIESQIPFIAKLVLAASLIFTAGLMDDVIGLRPRQKLAGQLAGSLVAWWAGVRISSLAGYGLPDWLSLPFTVVWLIGCTNAFNLIDGLDGLASGMGLFATLTTFIAALLHGNGTLALATLPLAGCLLGFLRYNFNPASVFLGDSGSLLIGFLLGCYGVIWSQKSATLIAMTAPLMALAIPILDVCLSVARRWLRGQPIFTADRGHIHHRLLDRGFTHRRVVLVLYGVCGIYAALSLLQSVAPGRFGGLIVLLFCLVTWIGIQHLGYLEFGAATRIVRGGHVRRLLHGEIAQQGFELRVRRAATAEQCWEALRDTSIQMGFGPPEAVLLGRRYGGPAAPHGAWQIRIPLAEEDYVNLWRDERTPARTAMILPWIECLTKQLPGKLAEISGRPTDVESLLHLAGRVGGETATAPRPRAAQLG